jgi:hypothetical protein
MNRIGTTCAAGLITVSASLSAEPSKVSLAHSTDGTWQLMRNGTPYSIRGAGGYTRLELLKELGGNTVRTWDVDHLGPTESGLPLLDECSRLGLTAMVGLWVNQPRHGFDYSDQTMLETQRDRVRTTVRQFRDHPAVLIWGLGNEMEGNGQDPKVWRELEVLTRIIKAEDPNHPVCSVLAGTGDEKIRAMLAHFPSLDILGINSYSEAENVDHELATQGWNRPFLLTEFGPRGPWEVALTTWHAPIEPTPAEKVVSYSKSYNAVMHEGRGLCLGAFAFLWGQKQETTATWFGMFLPTGEKTPVVDAIVKAWNGRNPPNQSPVIHSLRADFRERSAKPNSVHTVIVEVIDADQDSLKFDWQVIAESTDRKQGGDPEKAPPEIPDCVLRGDGPEALIRLPQEPGAYRVFVYIRDGHGGGASANFPFLIE